MKPNGDLRVEGTDRNGKRKGKNLKGNADVKQFHRRRLPLAVVFLFTQS